MRSFLKYYTTFFVHQAIPFPVAQGFMLKNTKNNSFRQEAHDPNFSYYVVCKVAEGREKLCIFLSFTGFGSRRMLTRETSFPRYI